jgi:predicted RNA binding protein YcfA (HicA-like mRNA interferase family)
MFFSLWHKSCHAYQKTFEVANDARIDKFLAMPFRNVRPSGGHEGFDHLNCVCVVVSFHAQTIAQKEKTATLFFHAKREKKFIKIFT